MARGAGLRAEWSPADERLRARVSDEEIGGAGGANATPEREKWGALEGEAARGEVGEEG